MLQIIKQASRNTDPGNRIDHKAEWKLSNVFKLSFVAYYPDLGSFLTQPLLTILLSKEKSKRIDSVASMNREQAGH